MLSPYFQLTNSSQLIVAVPSSQRDVDSAPIVLGFSWKKTELKPTNVPGKRQAIRAYIRIGFVLTTRTPASRHSVLIGRYSQPLIVLSAPVEQVREAGHQRPPCPLFVSRRGDCDPPKQGDLATQHYGDERLHGGGARTHLVSSSVQIAKRTSLSGICKQEFRRCLPASS